MTLAAPFRLWPRLFSVAILHRGNIERRTFEEFSKLCKDTLNPARATLQLGVNITRDYVYWLLQICEKEKDLESARMIQSVMVFNGFDTIAVLGDFLIRIFTYHRNLVEANQVFYKIVKPGPHTWAAIIFANAKCGQDQVTLELYHSMQLSGMEGDRYIYVAVSKGCTITNSIVQGRLIHEQMIKGGYQLNIVVGSTLVNMYAKCGSLEEASEAFGNLQNRDVISWSAMVAGYAQHGELSLALDCLEKMQLEGIKPNLVSWNAIIAGHSKNGDNFLALQCFYDLVREGIKPDAFTFSSAVKASANVKLIKEGRLLHGQIIGSGYQSNNVVGSALVDMYAKCGSLEEAEGVFCKMPSRNIISWNAMLAGYIQHGECHLAIEGIEQMMQEGVKPDLISWNLMIGGHVLEDKGLQALEYYRKMQEEGIKPDKVTFLSMLKACSSIDAIDKGKLFHGKIIRDGYQDDMVVGNALVDMYSKCDCFDEALKVFTRLQNQDVVSWCSLIDGFAEHKKGYMAIKYSEKMQEAGIEPNEIAYLGILKACSDIGEILKGRFMHNKIIVSGLLSDEAVGITLVDMYAKCGSLNEACRVFGKLKSHNVVSWSAMIAGYAQHGEGHLALECFERMKQKGMRPDEVSFASVLIACSHVGLVDEGFWYYQTMDQQHGIEPSIHHFICMVGLLSRAGCLHEAEKLLQSTAESELVGWISLLSACKVHVSLGRGRRCFEKVLSLNSYHAAGYVIMSNLFADLYTVNI